MRFPTSSQSLFNQVFFVSKGGGEKMEKETYCRNPFLIRSSLFRSTKGTALGRGASCRNPFLIRSSLFLFQGS